MTADFFKKQIELLYQSKCLTIVRNNLHRRVGLKIRVALKLSLYWKALMQQNGVNIDNSEENEVATSSKNKGGGYTCCVPLCYNNSKRNRDLSFYVIPSEKKLRKEWLRMISRKDFKPTSGHRMCSAHFEGGVKTYSNNVPTIVPKMAQPLTIKRTSRNSLGLKCPVTQDQAETRPNKKFTNTM